MNENNGQTVKYIDGIYKRQSAPVNAIQVELPFETPVTVVVQRPTISKPAKQLSQQTNDKFYAMATAALTGVKVSGRTKFRLQKRKSSASPTIADLTKRLAKETKQGTQLQDKAPMYMQSNTRMQKVVAKTHLNIKHTNRTIKKSATQLYHRFDSLNETVLRKTVAILMVCVIILLAAVGGLIYRNQRTQAQAKSTLETQRAQSDVEWRKLEASWQCINKKWDSLQIAGSVQSNQANTTNGVDVC